MHPLHLANVLLYKLHQLNVLVPLLLDLIHDVFQINDLAVRLIDQLDLHYKKNEKIVMKKYGILETHNYNLMRTILTWFLFILFISNCHAKVVW